MTVVSATGDGSAAFDFLVIGAQKAGTTSLWHYLREHPRIRLPRAKEVPFFTRPDPNPQELRSLAADLLADAPSGVLLGKVTPSYMIGNQAGRPNLDVPVVAGRIATALPTVKLVAVLRNPIERAVSSYLMLRRRGFESRSLDAALDDLLDPDALVDARLRPTHTSSYVIAGEYGRILAAYRDAVPAERMLIAFSDDLNRDPGAVLDEILDFLGLPTGFRPRGLDLRHFRGGIRKLLEEEPKAQLFEYFEQEILPKLEGDPDKHRRAFEFFFTTWNVALEEKRPSLSLEVRAALEDHYVADAERLRALGVDAPWI